METATNVIRRLEFEVKTSSAFFTVLSNCWITSSSFASLSSGRAGAGQVWFPGERRAPRSWRLALSCTRAAWADDCDIFWYDSEKESNSHYGQLEKDV